MFNLQGGEIIIVLLLALVVLGPEKLPEAMRKAGRAYGELRKMSSGFQEEFRKAVQEPVDEMKGSVRETANMLRDSADFTKLSSGERDEKPKSGQMSAAMPSVPLVAPADPTVVPTDATPTFESAADDPGEPAEQAQQPAEQQGEQAAAAEQVEPVEAAEQAEQQGDEQA